MNKTNIEWCDYTFNPITGCKRGCSYCYAKKINDRFTGRSFTDIVFHPDRLYEPGNVKKPSIIFVGSMSDIEYWEPKHLNAVLETCFLNSQHTFMFLSKNPDSYSGFKWPKNTMQGLTLTKITGKEDVLKIISMLNHCSRPFLSIEPLLGKIEPKDGYGGFEKIIVGAMTGPGAVVPEKEWMDSLNNIPKDKLFLKSNIKKYMDIKK